VRSAGAVVHDGVTRDGEDEHAGPQPRSQDTGPLVSPPLRRPRAPLLFHKHSLTRQRRVLSLRHSMVSSSYAVSALPTTA
jgi:hypothetical protein